MIRGFASRLMIPTRDLHRPSYEKSLFDFNAGSLAFCGIRENKEYPPEMLLRKHHEEEL